MPYELEVDPRSRIAYLHGSGSTNPDEGHATLVELAAHPDFKPGFGLLCDLREMDYEPTADEVIAGKDNVVRFKPFLRSRIAFVAPPALALPSELSAALYSAQGLDTRVFSDFDEALQWVKEATQADSAA
jgi:hypothetical protein